ncbi:MAG: hypothetical protein GY925_23050 [Actinomycetia bacterium]|nr:hypothetical protein [Actinomycetes bacterium]
MVVAGASLVGTALVWDVLVGDVLVDEAVATVSSFGESELEQAEPRTITNNTRSTTRDSVPLMDELSATQELP